MKAYHLPPDARPPPVWRLSRPNVRARIRRMDTRALAQIYKLNPTTAQRVAFLRLTGCRRYVYNWALARRREHYAATGKHLSSAALSRELTALKHHPDTAFLAEVDSQALQQALRDADRAYTNFFAGRARRPRFASRHRGDRTARIPQRVTVDEATGTVAIPKVGHVRLRLSRPPQGVVKSATIRGDACGDWFVSLRLEAPTLVDAPVSPALAATNAVGIDLGLTTYATLSTGEAIANPRYLRTSLPALKRAQRALARKQRGSKNRQQARLRVARLHRQVARQRADCQHKLSTDLVRRFNLLCVENLNLPGLARTKLARSFADVAFGEFLRQVRYKAAWHGKHVVAVGRWFPSSKTCGDCGHVYAALGRGERVWTCAACGVTHDRDANAARNILVEGTRLFGLRQADTGARPVGAVAASRRVPTSTTSVAAGPPAT
jgi:putative transposase